MKSSRIVLLILGLLTLAATSAMAVVGDLSGNGVVDIFDVNVFSDNWLRTDCNTADCEGADFSGDGDVNFIDWSIFAANWDAGDSNGPNTPLSVDVNSTLESDGTLDGRLWGTPLGAGAGSNNKETVVSNEKYSLRLGDLEGFNPPDYSYQSLLSFDTSSFLQEGFEIKSARIELTVGAVTGNSPFEWGGECVVDIAAPYFGGSEVLEANDWEAEADALTIATFSDPGANTVMVSSELTQAGLDLINTTGLTQFKIQFTNPNDGDAEYDYLSCYSGDAEGADIAKKPKLIITHSSPPPIVEFESIDVEDGRIWSDGNIAVDYADSDQYALRLGDYGVYLYKSYLSFDTSSLPDDCTILSVTVEMTKGSGEGTSPFADPNAAGGSGWGGVCNVDIANPYLGADANLDANDWDTGTNVTAAVATFADPNSDVAVNGTMVSSELNTAGLAQINKTGKTQFRIYFDNLTNADGDQDYASFYSANSTGQHAGKKPKLKVQYLPAD